MMKAYSSAPTRIDLAGGTLDIYPLYIFEGGGLTVNIAISLNSLVEVAPRKDSKIVIFSRDLNKKVNFKSIDAVNYAGPLGLIAKAVKFYWKNHKGLDIITKNNVPKGSGLGASSSLLMALSGALNALAGENVKPNDLIDWGANLEAEILGIPTGKQDYFAAVYGGINIINFDERGSVRQKVQVDEKFRKTLERHLILSYTGISHFSGTHNWEMMKRYIDKDKVTVKCLKRIKDTAYSMKDAILEKDIGKITDALAQEWENRKRLARGVTNYKIDKLISEAKLAGACASKVCGAGGGGCIVTITPPENREKVIQSLKKCGAMPIEFFLDFKGMQVEIL